MQTMLSSTWAMTTKGGKEESGRCVEQRQGCGGSFPLRRRNGADLCERALFLGGEKRAHTSGMKAQEIKVGMKRDKFIDGVGR